MQTRVWGPHGECRVRTYNGGLGQSLQHVPGVDTLLTGSGALQPEAEHLFALSQPEESTNLS